MGSLADEYAQKYAGQSATPLFRGSTTRNVGATPITQPAIRPDQGNAIQQFGKKVVNVAEQSGQLITDAGKAVGKFVANTPKYVYNDVQPFLKGIASTVTNEYGRDLKNINTQTKQLDDQMASLTTQYKSGKISKDNYSKMAQDIASSYQDLSKDSKKIATAADRGKVLESAAMTAGDVLTFGELTPAAVTGKQVAEAGGKATIKVLLDEGATGLEKLAMKVPGISELIERNLAGSVKRLASETTGEFIAREGAHVAGNLLIKRPVFYQSNVGLAKETLNGIVQGNYPQALKSGAWIALQTISGGVLGASERLFGKAQGGLSKLAYGTGSFIDELSARTADNIALKLSEMEPEAKAEAEKILRVMQESNLRVTGEDVPTAVDNVLSTYNYLNDDQIKELTLDQILTDAKKHRDADELLQSAIKSGAIKLSPDEASRLTPVRWDNLTRDAVANAKSFEEVQQIGEQAGFANNYNLMQRLQQIFSTSNNVRSEVLAIDAARVKPGLIPQRIANAAAKLGYTFAEPVGGRVVPFLQKDDTRKLISSAVKGGNELFDETRAANPVLNTIVGFMEKVGLSPRSSGQAATRKLGESVAATLSNTEAARSLGMLVTGETDDLARGGQAILSTLNRYVEDKPGIKFLSSINGGRSALQDIRQLTTSEIQEALGGVSKQEAKEVYSAIVKGYRDVPLELRGLGDKVVDTLFNLNPLQKYYSRMQSALRYTYNPFFRVQERAETKILSHGEATNLIWNKSRNTLNEAARILDDNRIFSGVLPGEAASDQVLGRITANISQGQKRDLAGLALDIAEKRGMTLDTLAKQHPEDLDDALRVIVQYPRRGAISSPLARTLNLMFFPMRYNLKVTKLAADILSKQPPSIQKAVIHSGFQLANWLKSDEGIRWQSKNADAIQLFNWVTPTNSLEYTFGLLNGVDSPAELGSLGGLPLGFVTQILDGQGIIKLNKPYVDPKTGDVFPDYIPKTAKARAATALSDLLDTMFTYPGRTLGLPGKEAAVRKLVDNFIATQGKDFDKRVDMKELTPLQLQMVQVLKGDTSKETIDSLYNLPAPGQFNWYTLPPLSLPVQPKRNLPVKTKTKKAKTVAQPL